MALAMQTTMDRFLAGRPIAIDLVLVSIVYVALTRGPAGGLLTGCFAGLIQDALTSGVIGIGGLAKTIVGYGVGAVGRQFIVSEPLPRLVVFFVGTIVHSAIFVGLYVLLGLRQFDAPYAGILGQAAGNSVVGLVAFQVAEFLPGAVERRRATRGRGRR